MKHKLLLGVIASGIMFTNTTVNALTGNAAVEFNGNDTAIVGETFNNYPMALLLHEADLEATYLAKI